MDLLELLIALTVAGICGAIAQVLVGVNLRGLNVTLSAVIIGVLGAFIGGWLYRRLGLAEFAALEIGNVRMDLVWTIIGALIFLGLLQLIRGGRDLFGTGRGHQGQGGSSS